MKNPATVADAEHRLFKDWYRVEARKHAYISPHDAWMARAAIAHAAPVGADVAASVLLKLCDQLDAMKLRLRAIPGEGQRESYYVADDVNCCVEEARAALAGAPAETVRLISSEANWPDAKIIEVLHSCGVDTYPSKHGFSATQVSATSIPTLRAVLQILAGAKPATWPRGTIVRKKSGSEWEGAIVGTYSSSITPEGYAVESSTHKGSVQIYPVGALELVTKGNV